MTSQSHMRRCRTHVGQAMVTPTLGRPVHSAWWLSCSHWPFRPSLQLHRLLIDAAECLFAKILIKSECLDLMFYCKFTENDRCVNSVKYTATKTAACWLSWVAVSQCSDCQEESATLACDVIWTHRRDIPQHEQTRCEKSSTAVLQLQLWRRCFEGHFHLLCSLFVV